jgi:hypothetical protein
MDMLNNKINKLKRIEKTIKLLDKKYDNKLIHTSHVKLKLEDLFNKNDINESRVTTHNGNPSKVYDNPYGLWVSCGSSWLKWIIMITQPYYENSFINNSFIYEIIVNEKNILRINNLEQLIEFQKKYGKYANNGYKIQWNIVKKDYDGLIICPYLGKDIWNKINNPTIISIDNYTSTYIKDSLGENIMKYPKIYLEWYRHWEASTGVIWRKKGIKKINLIKI